MKIFTVKLQSGFLLALTLILSMSCQRYSEEVRDKSAGMNGGFEFAKKGLPVNWLMYTSNTVPDADFRISLDKELYKEGKQSLKFEVIHCTSAGSWQSPGFTNEFFTSGKYNGDRQYSLSFWVRNEGTKFIVSAGGVSEKSGHMQTLVESSEQIESWQRFEYQVFVPEGQWLRMELNVLQAGSFWIDDIRIEEL